MPIFGASTEEKIRNSVMPSIIGIPKSLNNLRKQGTKASWEHYQVLIDEAITTVNTLDMWYRTAPNIITKERYEKLRHLVNLMKDKVIDAQARPGYLKLIDASIVFWNDQATKLLNSNTVQKILKDYKNAVITMNKVEKNLSKLSPAERRKATAILITAKLTRKQIQVASLGYIDKLASTTGLSALALGAIPVGAIILFVLILVAGLVAIVFALRPFLEKVVGFPAIIFVAGTLIAIFALPPIFRARAMARKR